ncbi:MAG TPA: ABC transporter permease subunit [Gemmatimonadaceae bacterium]|nr:ABC transporter permease subunit [Gemmatimonadaceae bacterium]
MTAVGISKGNGSVWRVAQPQTRDVIRSRWLVFYFVFFLLATEGMIRFTGGDAKALLSMSNIVLFVVPFVTLVYGTVYLYGSREFIELLLAQPIKRSTLFAGLYLGLTLPLVTALVAGMSLPFIFHGFSSQMETVTLLVMLAGTAALTAAFTAIAFFIALRFDDRLTGLGVGMAIWLALGLLYDGLLLVVVMLMPDRAIEKTLLAVTLANPIDLVRIALLMRFDVSAVMGYTGAVFRSFFSDTVGIAIIVAAMAAWIALPLSSGFLAFKRKDF